MSREFTVRPVDWQLIQDVAPAMVASRLFGVTEAQAPVIMLKGHELGLGLATSFEFIYVIEGKPSISPQGALALIRNSGQLKELKIEDFRDGNGVPVECSVYMERVDGSSYSVTFSMDDAARAGVIKPNSGWEKYPANMLRWRAVGYCADVVFPDVVGGLSRPEELGAEVDEQGGPWVVTVPESADLQEWQDSSAVTTTIPERETPKPVASVTITDVTVPDEPVLLTEAAAYLTIDSLLAGWTADEIMAANKGNIPATSEDCQRVAEKLLEAQDAG